jgi:integrase
MLTDYKIKSMEKKEKAYRVADNEGLVLEVRPTGCKFWRFRYRFFGKPNLLTIGKYPAVSLKEAREQRDKAKEILALGQDPNECKKQIKADQKLKATQKQEEAVVYRFNDAFNDWFDFKSGEWTSARYTNNVEGRYRMYLKPTLGDMPIEKITPIDVINALKLVEITGKLGALAKVKTALNQILKFSVSMGKIPSSPMRDIDNSIFKKSKKRNFAHQTNPDAIRQVFRKLWQPSTVDSVSVDAAKLVSLTFLRAGEVASLKWSFVDLENMLIRVPSVNMKMKREHLVPISRQTLEIIENRKLKHLGGEYVFPSPTSPRKTHITTDAMVKVLRIKGITQNEFTTHGWRHAATTTLNELGFSPAAIEAQASHVIRGVAGVYNKAIYLDERVRMMQFWADWLEK